MMIRKMQLDDLPQVAALEQSLFGDPWSEKAFRDTLEQEEADFIVAVNAQNEIIGYCGAYRALYRPQNDFTFDRIVIGLC